MKQKNCVNSLRHSSCCVLNWGEGCQTRCLFHRSLSLLSLVLLFSFPFLWLQARSYAPASPIFPTRIYDELVGNVQVRVHPAPKHYRPYPVMNPQEGEKIEISFDLLDDVPQIVEFSITHCSALWNPSGLSFGDYMSGPERGLIDQSQPSGGTWVSYRHYALRIGQGELYVPRQSGNFLFKAWISGQGSEETPLFQAAFAVLNEQVTISQSLTASTQATLYDKHQAVEVELEFDGMEVPEPSYYKILVGQNASQGRVALLTRPSGISGGRLLYANQQAALFWAGNHFRATEILTDKYNGMGVNHSYLRDGISYMELFADTERASGSYVHERSAQGRYRIRNVDQEKDANLTTDYYAVSFTLHLSPEEAKDGLIFLEGGAFDALPVKYKRLSYNSEKGSYELTVLLKGGYIGYRYCLASPDKFSLDTPFPLNEANTIEGDYYQTDNNYTALVYRRLPSDRCDCLIGMNTLP